MTPEAAAERAVQECIREGILSEFLRKNYEEVKNMFVLEYHEDIAQKGWFEDGREEGLKQGMEKGMEKGMEQGLLEGGIKEIIDCYLDGDYSLDTAVKRAGKYGVKDQADFLKRVDAKQ